MQTITEHTMKHITTDEMNDIIQGWIEAELPINPAGYEDPGQRDALRDAQGKRFESICNMGDAAFRALYREKTGRDIGPMNSDGSYTEVSDSVLDELRNMPSIPSGDIITQAQANRIARLALDGDPHYSHEAIGEDDGDINDMESETGGRRIIRADNDSEVAVYERADGSIVIVADANGPIAITAI